MPATHSSCSRLLLHKLLPIDLLLHGLLQSCTHTCHVIPADLTMSSSFLGGCARASNSTHAAVASCPGLQDSRLQDTSLFLLRQIHCAPAAAAAAAKSVLFPACPASTSAAAVVLLLLMPQLLPVSAFTTAVCSASCCSQRPSGVRLMQDLTSPSEKPRPACRGMRPLNILPATACKKGA
jgi:hypothetical protein